MEAVNVHSQAAILALIYDWSASGLRLTLPLAPPRHAVVYRCLD